MVDKRIQLNTSSKSGSPAISKDIRLCLYITLICNFFILLGNPLQNDFMVSWATRALILSVCAETVWTAINWLRKRRIDIADAYFLAIIFFSAISMLFGGVFGMLKASIAYLCFLMLPGYIVLYRRADNISRLKTAVYIANIFYTGVYIYLRFTDRAFIYYGDYGEEIIEDLTLGYGNANETGIYLMLSFFIMLSAFFAAKKRWHKGVIFLLSGVLFYLLWETDCRVCIILVAVVLVLTVSKWLFRLQKRTILVALLIPLLSLILVRVMPDTLKTLNFMGDSVDTGRYFLFDSFFDRLTIGSFFFGDVARYPGSNMHNSYLSLLAMFGALTVIPYVLFLNTSLKVYYEKLSGTQRYVAFAGVLAVIIHGSVEGTLIMSGTVYAGMAGLLFLLMLPEEMEI